MTKSRQMQKPVPKPQPPQQRPAWLITVVIAGAVMALIAIIAAVVSSQQPTVEPEVQGAPRAEVDQTVVDHGNQHFNQMVESVFTVRNVGDQPLIIQGEPRVELLQGC